MRFFKSLVDKFEINLSSPHKNKQFRRALSELVSILFAVVFGVGLSQLGQFKEGLDLLVLIVAYFAIIMSWWGYHYGTIEGPPETNFLSYSVDILIVISYWFLINWREPLWVAALWCAVIFALYFSWEAVRYFQGKWSGARKAMWCNITFTCLAVGTILAARQEALFPLIIPWVIPVTVLLLLVLYRFHSLGVCYRLPESESHTDNVQYFSHI